MIRATATLALALLAVPSVGVAQSFDPDAEDEFTFVFQLERPIISDAEGLAFWSSILSADAVFPVGGSALSIGVPIAVAGADSEDETSIYAGNFHVALLFGDRERLSGVVDLTVPTANNLAGSDLAAFIGLFSRIDETGRWFDDTVALRGELFPARPLAGGGHIGLRLGTYLIAPDDLDNLNVHARLGGWGRFPTDNAEFRVDLGGSYLVNSDGGVGPRFTSYATFAANLTGVSARPGLFVRIPLDGDARETLDLSIGLRLEF